MKLILLFLISIDIVFAAKCPTNGIIAPCTCFRVSKLMFLIALLINNFQLNRMKFNVKQILIVCPKFLLWPAKILL